MAIDGEKASSTGAGRLSHLISLHPEHALLHLALADGRMPTRRLRDTAAQ